MQSEEIIKPWAVANEKTRCLLMVKLANKCLLFKLLINKLKCRKIVA